MSPSWGCPPLLPPDPPWALHGGSAGSRLLEDPAQGGGSSFPAQECLGSPWAVPAMEGWLGLKLGLQGALPAQGTLLQLCPVPWFPISSPRLPLSTLQSLNWFSSHR